MFPCFLKWQVTKVRAMKRDMRTMTVRRQRRRRTNGIWWICEQWRLLKKQQFEYPGSYTAPCAPRAPCNVVQSSHELRRKYWVTHLSIRSFACTGQSYACSALLASLASSTALICLLTHSLPSSWESVSLDISKRPSFVPQDHESMRWKRMKMIQPTYK